MQVLVGSDIDGWPTPLVTSHLTRMSIPALLFVLFGKPEISQTGQE
jgi:hypothetical protein